MKAKIKQLHPVTKSGFSRWEQPQMGKYFLGCCDCGLVHEMQLRIVAGPVRGGHIGQEMAVQFRARRAPRYTARERKQMGVVFK